MQLNWGELVRFKEHYMGQQQREDDLNDLLQEILGFSETFFTASLFVLASEFFLKILVLESNVVIFYIFYSLYPSKKMSLNSSKVIMESPLMSASITISWRSSLERLIPSLVKTNLISEVEM